MVTEVLDSMDIIHDKERGLDEEDDDGDVFDPASVAESLAQGASLEQALAQDVVRELWENIFTSVRNSAEHSANCRAQETAK